MSTRLVIAKLLKHGKQVFQNAVRHKGKPPAGDVNAKAIPPARNEGAINHVFQPPKRLILGRLFPLIPVRTLASELRRRAATRLVSPVWPTFAFAFAGLSLQHQEDDQDGLSSEVRNIFSERQGKESILSMVQRLSLDVFDLGKMIGQGSNAAVYEAKLKPTNYSDGPTEENCPSIVTLDVDSASDSDIIILDNDDDFSGLEEVDDDLVVVRSHGDDLEDSDIFILHRGDDLEDSDTVLLSDLEDTPVMVSAFQNEERTRETTVPDLTDSLVGLQNRDDYNLAIKMMYNYDIESNADSIMRAMMKEAIPARLSAVNQPDNQLWQNGNRVRLKPLQPHPNIVEMVGVFVDPMPNLPEALDHYPAAIPQRLNPQGLGRNQTMFLVMKKYDLTLRQYLAQEELSAQTRCLLLCQLLEGTVHLRNHDIAHRDMKSDNILLDCHSEAGGPNLVISDFGCCLAEQDNGLTLPYPTDEINKGGNGALMPPEISCTAPGRHVELDYSKSDLWAIGSMVYEVFGEDNPFYGGSRMVRKLDGRTYQDSDLPPLSDDVPEVVRFLIPRLLRRNPKQRPEAKIAANLLQIFLHFPDWLHSGNKPSKKDITDSLMILVTRVLIGWKWRCQRSFTVIEQLELTFLRRLVITDLMHSLDYYHGN